MEPDGGARPRKTTVACGPGGLALKPQPASIRAVLRRLVDGQRRRLVLVAVVSFLGGLAEALVLGIIAKLAFAIASNDTSITFTVSSIVVHTSGAELVLIAFSLTVARIGLQAVGVWESTNLATQVIRKGRADAVRLFLDASWALQSKERRGHLQEMTTTQVAQASAVLTAALTLLVSAATLIALLGAALFANALATLAAAVIVVVLALLFRPLRKRIRRRSSIAASANAEFAASISELSEISREIRVFGVEHEAEVEIGAAIDEH